MNIQPSFGNLHYQSTLHVLSSCRISCNRVPAGWGRARSPSPVAAAELYSAIASGLVSARHCELRRMVTALFTAGGDLFLEQKS